MPSLDGEYRRHPRPEYRLHYSGDVGRLLVGYDKVCRFVNVRTIEEALAARLKDHQSPADGKQDEPTLSRLDLSGVVVPGSHVHALVCAILARGPELRPPGITALTTLVLGCSNGLAAVGAEAAAVGGLAPGATVLTDPSAAEGRTAGHSSSVFSSPIILSTQRFLK